MVEISDQVTVKLLCSYDGKILPRQSDSRLRYVGGQTRILSLPRSIAFSDLIGKLSQIYGSSVGLRCQLPTEDLDALVTITSDEDFANLVEEYDKAAVAKIRAFLFPIRPKTPSPPSSVASSPAPGSLCQLTPAGRCVHHTVRFPPRPEKFARYQYVRAKPPLVQGSGKNGGHATPYVWKEQQWH